MTRAAKPLCRCGGNLSSGGLRVANPRDALSSAQEQWM